MDLDWLFGTREEQNPEQEAMTTECKPYHERYYAENKARLMENVKNWRAKNRAHYREYQRQWYQNNRIQRLQYLRNWRRNKKLKK